MVDAWGVAASLSLVAVAVALSVWWRLGLHLPLVISAVRAVGQLLLVGVVLVPVLRSDAELWWSWTWIAAMLVIAVGVVRRRTRSAGEHRPSILVTAIGVGAPLGVCLAIVFGLGVFDLRPVTLVPVAGIILGNSLPATVSGALRFEAQLDTDRPQIEAMLALGIEPAGAIRPTVQTSIRDALVPQIERTNVVGLVALPGAMTGLILAGVDPIDAVLALIVVMFLVIGAGAVTATFMTRAAARTIFTRDRRLAR